MSRAVVARIALPAIPNAGSVLTDRPGASATRAMPSQVGGSQLVFQLPDVEVIAAYLNPAEQVEELQLTLARLSAVDALPMGWIWTAGDA